MHGGRLSVAQGLYPNAPQPWLDLSTGINPWGYPLNKISSETWARLPEPTDIHDLERRAREAYAAPSVAKIVAVSGSDIAIAMLPRLVDKNRRVVIFGPTYVSHANAWARAGHQVTITDDLDALGAADVAIVVNPNNPDGRVVPVEKCLTIASEINQRNGLMIVDEAFGDAYPETSVVPELGRCPSLVVLRSFGKFYGLAGLRLGFAISAHPIVELLRHSIGDWPVSGPAIAIGTKALGDSPWVLETRARLATASRDVDVVLKKSGGEVIGGTSLFRLLNHSQAGAIFVALAEAGILVRPFDYAPRWLRIGLVPTQDGLQRLSRVLSEFHI
ncbi:MAG: threonine-phosphate decarboxylase CobD [Hyphomicrobiaceae bacterium]